VKPRRSSARGSMRQGTRCRSTYPPMASGSIDSLGERPSERLPGRGPIGVNLRHRPRPRNAIAHPAGVSRTRTGPLSERRIALKFAPFHPTTSSAGAEESTIPRVQRRRWSHQPNPVSGYPSGKKDRSLVKRALVTVYLASTLRMCWPAVRSKRLNWPYVSHASVGPRS